MAHDIWDDNFVYAGEPAWHGLGQAVDKNIDGPTLIAKLNLSEIGPAPLFALLPDGTYQAIGTHKAAVRAVDNQIVGVVTAGFEWTQDAALILMLEELRKEGLIRFNTAGQLREGSRFFVCLDIPGGTLRLKTPKRKEDIVANYIMASHGHDGTLAHVMAACNTRVVCQNTERIARAEGQENGSAVYIKHTKNAPARMDATVKLYAACVRAVQRNNELAQVMVKTKFDQPEMTQLLDILYPAKENGELTANVLKARYDINTLVYTGKGHEQLGITGTAWGAYQAVTEYLDWHRPTRGDKLASAVEKTEKRMQAAWFDGPITEKKELALNTIVKLANIQVAA